MTLAEFLNNDSDTSKFGGWETLTHEEALRRQARAELLEPIRKPEVAGMADALARAAGMPGSYQLAEDVGAAVSAMARDRARKMDEWLAPRMEAIHALRESGVEVWLEESPAEFETDGGDVWRSTSTARLRYTGDGFD